MTLYQQFLTKNDCYKTGTKITPKGIMVHSTGANNPKVSRYIPGNATLGVNAYNNHWNKSGVSKCAHAFIGKIADGTVATVQTLPWNYRGWHCGSGTSGKSANDTHIGFEICEDALKDEAYFNSVYHEAVDLCAYLCEQYNLDPLADGVVICHYEGYQRGVASGHVDVTHWFPKFGKTMDDFRADVKAKMGVKDTTDETDTNKNYIEYTVKSGDSWWKISANYYTGGADYKELQEYNNMVDATLHPGDVIKIPVEETPSTDADITAGVSSWAAEAWKKGYAKGCIDGTNPQGGVTREMLMVIFDSLGLLD